MTSGDTNLSEHEQRVDEAIAAYLDAIGRGEVVERSAFLARYPELAEELAAFLVDHERFRMFAGPLPGLGELGSLSTLDNAIQITAPTPRSPGDLPHRLDDYELVAEIARGGMGIVYKARQLSLHRIVALKMILAGRQASPSDVQRFRAEAELAASLDHPSIVPIYEVNSCEGIPFFSMKLIEGSNLAARDPRWQQDPRAAAKLVAQVARAVHHAHQRGLLHRDLKPANVLLDDQDHPYVTDFGLAKLLQHDDSITPSGGIVGTPRYMAPEQLKPRGPLTTASDVHGLGCILFEILTGRPAFPAASPAEALRTILEVEVDRPGTLNPRVPLDLETICLKCLEKEPGRRYSSAEALAEDLERFLQHEPIHARQISRAGRLLRWGRRRPVVAGLSGLLLFGSLAALVALTLLWQRAEGERARAESQKQQAEAASERAEKERARAEEQKQQAEKAFRQTHRAIRDFCIDLSFRKLADVPGMQPVRRKLLEGAVRHYEQFVKERGDDAVLLAELAATYAWIADLDAQSGDRAAAIEGYRKAIDGLEKVLAMDKKPENLIVAAVQADLGRSYNRLAIQLDVSGQPAEATYLKAKALFEELLRGDPGNLDHVTDLNAVENNLADIYRNQGRIEAARRCLEELAARIENLRRQHPEEARLMRNLSFAERSLASLDSAAGKHAAALERFQHARKLLLEVVAKNPRRLDIKLDLAHCHRELADELLASKDRAAALESYQQAHAVLEELVKLDGSVSAYRSQLASVCRALGRLYKQDKDLQRALDAFQQSRRELEKVKPLPERPLAESFFEMAGVLASHRQFNDALTCYQEATRLHRQVLDRQPADALLRGDLGNALTYVAQMQFNTGKRDDAVVAVREACREVRRALKAQPDNGNLREQASFACRARGEIEGKMNHLPEAAEAFLEYRDLFPANATEQYNAARELALVASLVGKDKKTLSTAEQAERDRYARLALDTLREAVRSGFKDAARLEQDSSFQALREHPDYQAVLKSLGR